MATWPKKLRVRKADGTAVVDRSDLNFVGSGVTVLDNPTTKRTDITIAGGGSAVNGVFYAQRDYGAVGDNVTNDTAALQAWITAFTSVGGLGILEDGNYKTDPLTIPYLYSGWEMQGYGQPWLHKRTTGTTAPIIHIGPVGNLPPVEIYGQIRNVHFSGIPGDLTGNGIQVENCGYLDFLDCRFYYFNKCISAPGSLIYDVGRCWFHLSNYGLHMTGGGQRAQANLVDIYNCHFTYQNHFAGVYHSDGNGIWIRGCQFEVNDSGCPGIYLGETQNTYSGTDQTGPMVIERCLFETTYSIRIGPNAPFTIIEKNGIWGGGTGFVQDIKIDSGRVAPTILERNRLAPATPSSTAVWLDAGNNSQPVRNHQNRYAARTIVNTGAGYTATDPM